jgi:hypothetical protein
VRDQDRADGWRFATGFFLAGIYPVGMKIAAQWYRKGLGAALGLLIGALVLGSASAARAARLGDALPWDRLMWAWPRWRPAGGLLLYAALGEPPARPGHHAVQLARRGHDVDRPRVRSSVLGYFGHMWELYTVWVLVPLVLATRLQGRRCRGRRLPCWARAPGLRGRRGCWRSAGAARAWPASAGHQRPVLPAGAAGLVRPTRCSTAGCCWGITVAGDSPQFSALTARNAPPQAVGSVLTLTNSIGFAISIVSILLFVTLAPLPGRRLRRLSLWRRPALSARQARHTHAVARKRVLAGLTGAAAVVQAHAAVRAEVGLRVLQVHRTLTARAHVLGEPLQRQVVVQVAAALAVRQGFDLLLPLQIALQRLDGVASAHHREHDAHHDSARNRRSWAGRAPVPRRTRTAAKKMKPHTNGQ